MSGERQALKWRVASSFAWSVILLPVCFVIFIIFSRIDILHPIQWLTDALRDIGSSYTIVCLLLMCVLLGIHCTLHVEFYTVVPSIPCSRLSLIGHILLPQRVLHSVAHAFMGMLVAWCCAVLSKGQYQLLVVPCTTTQGQDEASVSSVCLNESHLFLLLAGTFFGYSYSLLYFVHNMNYLPFPTIQQFKYLQFRRCLPLLIKQSCVQSLYLVRNYTIVYIFFGYIPRTWIQTVMNIQIDGQQPPLDTFRGLLNLSLFYQIWWSGTFLLATWYMVWVLFRIYATEACLFPVQTSFAEEAEKCLPYVLSSSAPPIVKLPATNRDMKEQARQRVHIKKSVDTLKEERGRRIAELSLSIMFNKVKYLAMQDLVLLSQYSPSRRQEVFSLSLPGGHPHNWTAISKECLNLLSSLTNRLIAHQEAAASNGRARLPSTPGQTRKSSSVSGAPLNEEPTDQNQSFGMVPRVPIPSLLKTTSLKSSLDTESPFASPKVSRLSETLDPNSPWHGSVQSPHIMRRGAKLWTYGSDGQRNGTEMPSSSQPTLYPAPNREQKNLLYTWCWHRIEQIKNFLSKRVLIMYLFSKHPEASSQDVFSDAQIHIWALEGLSHLVASSFSEDRMGVVQTTLSAILGTFLTLQEAVDKHFKLPHASSKPARNTGGLLDPSYKTLRFSLRAALKTAIYRITTTFGEHIHAVPVSSEHRKKLQQFLDFKE